MLSKIFLHIFLFCTLGFQAIGQYIFTNLQTKDGLSTNDVFCAYNDTDGFIWFGTSNGLNRYDGSGFKVFNGRHVKAKTVSTFSVHSIIENGNNKLWVGSNTGLYDFEKSSSTFTSIPFLNQSKSIINDVNVNNIQYDEQHRLWIFTSKGLYILKENKAYPVASFYPSADIFDNILVYTINSGDKIQQYGLWVFTLKGLCYIDFKNGATYTKQNNPLCIAMIEESQLYGMCIDEGQNLLFSSDDHPLARYNFITNEITDVSSWNLNIKNYGIYKDNKNRIWVSNYSGRLNVLDAHGKIKMLPDDSPENYKPFNNLFSSIKEDDDNNLWFTGPNGISKLRHTNYLENIISFPNYSIDSTYLNFEINNIYNKGDGKLWVCKDDGLFQWDSLTGTIKRFGISDTEVKQNRVFDIKLIEGEWWCSTGDGIKIFNPETEKFRKFQHYAKDYIINNISAIWIHQDRQGMIWFALWNNAVYKYNPISKTTVRVDVIRSTDISNPILTNSLCVLENTDGKIWFGNGDKGVIIFDTKKNVFTTPKFLNNQIVRQLIKDTQNNVWLATSGHGILKANSNGELLDSIGINDGLEAATHELSFDNNGVLWAGSNLGIFSIDIHTKLVSKLNINMGQPKNDPNGAMYLLDDKLYGSVLNKLAIVNLSKVENIYSQKPPLISGIRVFEKEIAFDISNPTIHLKHNENFFSIQFSSLYHNESSSVKYAYHLDGFDRKWIYCDRRQIASYTNVPNGKYTFSVKCTDANGKWFDKQTNVVIDVSPPVYKTWWFMFSILILMSVILWMLYQANQKRLQKQSIVKTINYFANSVYQHNSVDEICWDIARNCISQMNFEDCVVYLYDQNKDKFIQKAAFGPKNPNDNVIKDPLEIELGRGIVGTVAKTGKALLINDTSKDVRYVVDDAIRLSEITVPIMLDQKVIGIIDSEHFTKNFFTMDHLKALTTIAAISANKMAEVNAANKAKEHEIKMLEINKMLAESQLMALRAQMNPHFVFNCLNSIQECIVTEKYGEASKYLNKFSKLFRMVLNNSGKKLVTLDDEKVVLELYLELEAMRFEKSFEYKITVDEDLDPDEILIPSMLIQPYVENALWHWLMHKDGDRKLIIAFNRKNEEVFECIVEDNGIGRSKSYALKEGQRKAKRHESKGLTICLDRLNVLKSQGFHAEMEITDKVDEHMSPCGTKIRIELSTELTNL
ncbi:MAG: histidine kinase [Saprospiraceae bacterium]|nr:histidine kinase [Saprospiraceae bacterium]